jgi:hypothetical protein
MSQDDAIYYKFVNLTASALVQTGATKLGGIFCASSTAGTAKVWDSTAASGAVCVNTFTLVAGTYYTIPATLKLGLFVTIGGTADVTVFYI